MRLQVCEGRGGALETVVPRSLAICVTLRETALTLRYSTFLEATVSI